MHRIVIALVVCVLLSAASPVPADASHISAWFADDGVAFARYVARDDAGVLGPVRPVRRFTQAFRDGDASVPLARPGSWIAAVLMDGAAVGPCCSAPTRPAG